MVEVWKFDKTQNCEALVFYYSQIFITSADGKNESADPKQKICRFCPNQEIFNYFWGYFKPSGNLIHRLETNLQIGKKSADGKKSSLCIEHLFIHLR